MAISSECRTARHPPRRKSDGDQEDGGPVTVRIVLRVRPGREADADDVLHEVMGPAIRRVLRGRGTWHLEHDDDAGTITEVLRFPNARAWEGTDALLCRDRYVAAANVLLDELLADHGHDFDVTAPARSGT